jgi:hypothetical protein
MEAPFALPEREVFMPDDRHGVKDYFLFAGRFS